MSQILAQGKVNLTGWGYEYVKHIGNGHFGIVQLVREINTGKQLVAKTISIAALNEKEHENAHREVLLLQSLRHPLIVEYANSFLIDGMKTLVILMEHCCGGDLRDRILAKSREEQRFDEARIMTWFAQILLALQYMHSEKVLHRDLKTSNIFLTEAAPTSTIKLGDFGISRVMEGTSDAAMSTVGTPYYMSPEVCRNEPYSWKSDVWALGCVVFELCALKRAFESASLAGLIYRIVWEKEEELPTIYSQALIELIQLLLSKTTDTRPSVTDCLEHPYAKPFLTQQASYAMTALPSIHDPRVRCLIIANRAQSTLSSRNQNGIAFAPFVEFGGAMMSKASLQSAFATLDLGLSQEEAYFFVESLAVGDGSLESLIGLAQIESTLTAAPDAAENRQLCSWAHQVLEPYHPRVSFHLQQRDARQGGVLRVDEFRAAFVEVVVEITEEQLDILTLMAHKTAGGDIIYGRFTDCFCSYHVRPEPVVYESTPPFPNDVAIMSDWGTAEYEQATFGETDNWGTAYQDQDLVH